MELRAIPIKDRSALLAQTAPMQTFERLVMAGASRQNGAVVGLVCMRQPVVLAANTL